MLLLLLVVFTLFILVDLAILAYWLLPDREPPQEIPVESPVRSGAPARPGPAAPPSRPAEKGASLPAETGLQAARRAWLTMKAEAEAADVGAWGGREYQAVTLQAAEADARARAGDHDAAVQGYTAAATGLQHLLAARPVLFRQAVERGSQALADGRADEARAMFTRALAIDPADAGARHGLERAASLDRVLALLQEGARLEQQGETQQALASYGRAEQLDPEYEPALKARKRLQGQLQDRRFRRAMGRFFTALDQGELEGAATALNEAAGIRTDDPAVREGHRALRAAQEEKDLAALAQRFSRLVRAEEWQQALAVCDRALAISPGVAFAVAGRSLAGERLALMQAMERILAHPLRLQEDGPLAEARQTLAVARAQADAGPRLRAGIADLAALLARATTPVPVTLRSDGRTSVVIYLVGRLGRFVEKRVQLRPGRYTVVGSRPGFRDVRRTLVVKGEQPPATLLILCEEPI